MTTYGDDFKLECPTGSGNRMNLFELAKEISRRLANIFLRDASGRRPVHGGASRAGPASSHGFSTSSDA
jgi:hypothetical protein